MGCTSVTQDFPSDRTELAWGERIDVEGLEVDAQHEAYSDLS